MKQFNITNVGTVMFGSKDEMQVPMTGLAFTAVAKDLINDKLFYIVYDKHFHKLPYQSQIFLIWHEIGHIVNGDLKVTVEQAMRIRKLRALGISNKSEFKADKFAVKHTSKKVGLKSLLDMKIKNPRIGSLDLIERAIAIILV